MLAPRSCHVAAQSVRSPLVENVRGLSIEHKIPLTMKYPILSVKLVLSRVNGSEQSRFAANYQEEIKEIIR